MPLCGQEKRCGQSHRRICLSSADMTGLATKCVEYSRPEVSIERASKPTVAQKRSADSHTLVQAPRANGQCPVPLLARPTRQCAQRTEVHAKVARPQHNRENGFHFEETAVAPSTSFLGGSFWISTLPLMHAPSSMEMRWVTTSPTTMAGCFRSTRSLA